MDPLTPAAYMCSPHAPQYSRVLHQTWAQYRASLGQHDCFVFFGFACKFLKFNTEAALQRMRVIVLEHFAHGEGKQQCIEDLYQAITRTHALRFAATINFAEAYNSNLRKQFEGDQMHPAAWRTNRNIAVFYKV